MVMAMKRVRVVSAIQNDRILSVVIFSAKNTEHSSFSLAVVRIFILCDKYTEKGL